MTKIPLNIIEHSTREENLRVAKQSAKGHEGSIIQHRIEYWKDVIDIVIGMDIIERHICYGRTLPYL